MQGLLWLSQGPAYLIIDLRPRSSPSRMLKAPNLQSSYVPPKPKTQRETILHLRQRTKADYAVTKSQSMSTALAICGER